MKIKAPMKATKIRTHHPDKKRTLKSKKDRKTLLQRDTFPLFVRTKINFMKIFGLKPTSSVIENIATKHNSGNLLNIDLKVIDDTIEIVCIDAICCPQCDVVFYSERSYNIHLSKAHPNRLQFYCKICSNKFITRALLQEHRSKHKGKAPYICSKCNARLKSLDIFIAHMRIHRGKLPYTCSMCKGVFDKKSDYKKHLIVHKMKQYTKSKGKIFNCTDCCKEFLKVCNLVRHRRTHTGEKPFVCAVCGSRFQQSHNMAKHMVTHTKEKKYSCDICTKEFGRKDVLTRHMLTHTINKPFSCDVCRKTFARAVQLTKHKKKRH